MFRAHQPVAQDLEETGGANIGRRVEIFGERPNRALVYLEEKTILTAKVLEDGSLSDADSDGNTSEEAYETITVTDYECELSE